MSAGGAHGKPKRGKKHAAHEEEHENHERWLVSYADMMTLLMVLFIVMFAISQVDQKKFAALKSGLAAGFGTPSVALMGSDMKISDSTGQVSPMNLDAGVGGAVDRPNVEDKALKEAVANYDRARAQKRQADAKREVANLEQIKKNIETAMAANGMGDSVRFTIDERGLVVTVVTSTVVFAGDRAELLSDGRTILDSIGPAISMLPNRIEVDGHTNQLNVQTQNYPSGWELSTARASTVVRYLHDRIGIPENRLFAAGYADTKPLYPASDARAAALNRRVEIVVLSTLPPEERALLPSAS